jgi:hypothetical protein
LHDVGERSVEGGERHGGRAVRAARTCARGPLMPFTVRPVAWTHARTTDSTSRGACTSTLPFHPWAATPTNLSPSKAPAQVDWNLSPRSTSPPRRKLVRRNMDESRCASRNASSASASSGPRIRVVTGKCILNRKRRRPDSRGRRGYPRESTAWSAD